MPYPWLTILSHSFILSLSLLLVPSSIAATGFAPIKTKIFPLVEIAQNSRDTEADQLFEEGEQLFEQKNPESFQAALKKFEQALPIYQASGNITQQAHTVAWIAYIYHQLGENQQALSYYNQALPLFRQINNQERQATALLNIGSVYSNLGDKQQALNYYNQAIPLYRQADDKEGEATTLNNIAVVYSDLGDKQTALNYYKQALTLSQQLGDKGGEANTLNSMGLLYYDLGDKQTALNYYNQALPLYQQVQYKWGEAAALNNIGGIYSDRGDKQTALNYYNQVLPIVRQLGDKAGEAYVLNNIGQVYDYLGDNQQALNYYNQVLPLLREVGDKAAEATVLRNLALLQRNLQQLDGAIANIEAAITIIENQRTKIVSEQLRQSYFAQNLVYYEIYIDLLMQLHQQQPDKGYDAKALNASERARARTLLELLAEANADIRTGVDPQLRQQESNLQERINRSAQNQIDLLSREHTPTQAAVMKQDLDDLLRQLDETQAEIRRRSPGYAALTQPQPLTLPQIQQQVLDGDTLLLQYSLGESRSYLWVVSQTGISSYKLPPRAEIETAAKNFREAITSPSLRIRPKKAVEAADALSKLILAPAAAQLGDKRLAIVSDGALYYIPFAALSLPGTNGEPLLVTHEIVNLPSASSLAILRQQVNQRPGAPKKAAILADPVFGLRDPRVAGKPQSGNDNLVSQMVRNSARDVGISGELAPLPNTRQEAAAILNLVPDAEEFAAFDFAANRETATSPKMADYQIVHFATHSFFNSENPQLSGLVMSLVDDNGQSVDGFLRLHDIFNLILNAELVVLSACQTGLGENVRGEGITGLTRGFMYAGAERLVTSLWSVDDEGTAALMTSFYGKMLSQGMTPAQEALRAAQLEMWQSQEWKLPYFRGAFTLQGEWR
ncbi:CHAT domain-containing tetratricopeptide repeat protein [[Phormidium] sp. ETS-05]|uniref:CHAT domain-containing tetratricopeptide repeat protein n=1 Tax=[Phormidium] sp. ETS-05 TaxID=222819 RepID=UPI0018EF1EC8|nr:CHAT domain-containing tetratricopeptide repeat protein [[Phormidium] sp. ETS-05]